MTYSVPSGSRVLGFAMTISCATMGVAACADRGEGPIGGGFPGDTPERELRETFRLGGLQSPDAETFQREPQLAVDRQGFLYILHQDLGRIAVFDAAGGFVRWIGNGRGEGPAEFTSAVRFGFIADTLWVRNWSPPRISLFLADGSYLGTDPVLIDVDYRTTAGAQGISGYLQRGAAYVVPDGFVMAPDPGEARAPFMIGNRDMEVRSTLFSWRAGRGRLAGTSFEPIPEPPFHDVVPDGSGIVVADYSDASPEQLVIRLFSPDGATLRSWEFSTTPIPIQPSVRDSLVQAGRRQVGEVRERVIAQGVPENLAPVVPTAAEVSREVRLPEYRPPIRGIRAGLDSTVWVQLPDGSGPGRWVAIDDDGISRFSVRLPDGARLRQASREAVWGTSIDELGVAHVIRWDLH
jgi:hypothetical protein